MERFIPVMVANIVTKLLDHVAGFTIGRNFLGHAQDCPGAVRSQVGGE